MSGNKTTIMLIRPLSGRGGFALIELLVSISIVMLVTTVILARHNSFDSAVLLRNQAYEVAFAIREAQLLAVSGAGETSEVQQYGVHVSTSPALNQRIVVFRDVAPSGSVPNGRYASNVDETISTTRLDNRFEIGDIIDGLPTPQSRTDVSVTFRRPNYDASFRRPCGAFCSGTITGPVTIVVRRVGSDDVRHVVVTASGQVSVERP